MAKSVLSPIAIDASKNAELQFEQLTQSVRDAGLDARKGWVVFAGRVADGSTRVQFNAGNDGWSSDWPEWAFGQAQLALVNNLSILVISNGLPWGSNLVQVLVFHLNG